MTQATTIGPNPELTPPQPDFRHGSGMAGQQEVARYAVQQGFSIDPALQQFAGHLSNEDPLGNGRARGAAGRQLTNLAKSPAVSPLPSEYTMGELNAEVAEKDPQSTFTMADVETSLAKTIAMRRNPVSAPQPSPTGQDTEPTSLSLAERVALAKKSGTLLLGDMSKVHVGTAEDGTPIYEDRRGYRQKAAGSDRVELSEVDKTRSAAASRRNLGMPALPGDEAMLTGLERGDKALEMAGYRLSKGLPPEPGDSDLLAHL